MTDETPNYNNYSREDLLDVLKNIDRENYPDRVKLVEEALKNAPDTEKPDQERNDKKALTIFALGSIEIVFWLVIGVLALAGFSIF